MQDVFRGEAVFVQGVWMGLYLYATSQCIQEDTIWPPPPHPSTKGLQEESSGPLHALWMWSSMESSRKMKLFLIQKDSQTGLVSLPQSFDLSQRDFFTELWTHTSLICLWGQRTLGLVQKTQTQPLFTPRNWTPGKKRVWSHICIFIIELKPADRDKRILGVGDISPQGSCFLTWTIVSRLFSKKPG